MRTFYSLTSLYVLSSGVQATNKWGARKCKAIEKAGEVNGDCQAELTQCSKATQVTDSTYQNCVNIQTMDAYWHPPAFSLCSSKYDPVADAANVQLCQAKIKSLINDCHTSYNYFKDSSCIELSQYKLTLTLMDEVNALSEDDLKLPEVYFWKVPISCQAFKYDAVSSYNSNQATTEQRMKYNTCIQSYSSMIPLQENCDLDPVVNEASCDAWWAHQANIPLGQKYGNPYGVNAGVTRGQLVDCDEPTELAQMGTAGMAQSTCMLRKNELVQLKENCNAENNGDATQTGQCDIYRRKRKDLLLPAEPKMIEDDMCDGDHEFFGTDMVACKAAVATLNQAKKDCATNGKGDASCDTLREVKKELFPTAEKDLCLKSADEITCRSRLAIIEGLQTDCAAELNGDETLSGSCNDLKIKKQQWGQKGAELNEAFKKPRRDICANELDQAACQANLDQMAILRKDCTAEAKQTVGFTPGSCQTLETFKTTNFPNQFFIKTPREYCANADATQTSLCNARVDEIENLKKVCMQENSGQIANLGKCEELKLKRKQIMDEYSTPTSSLPKMLDHTYCAGRTDEADCQVKVDLIMALRPQCISEHKGDATMTGKCQELHTARTSLTPNAYVAPCAHIVPTDTLAVAQCEQEQIQVANLKSDCRDEKGGDTSKIGACSNLSDLMKEILFEQSTDCASLPTPEEIDNCNQLAGQLTSFRHACKQDRANGLKSSDNCRNYAEAVATVPRKDQPVKPGKEQERLAQNLPPKKERPAHPCSTLTTAVEQQNCYDKYSEVEKLRVACRADKEANRANSLNCEDMKSKISELPVKPATKSKIPRNLCHMEPITEQYLCNQRYQIIVDKWESCRLDTLNGNEATSLDCIAINDNLALIPKKKTQQERIDAQMLHPCLDSSLDGDLAARQACYDKYDQIKDLRPKCKQDKANGQHDSYNCIQLKSIVDDPALPKPNHDQKKKDLLQATGGIVLRKRRSAGSKMFNYRR